jgi:hypothetical protein
MSGELRARRHRSWAGHLTYLWLLAPQLGVLERRLQVRRHAVDDVAVGALQKAQARIGQAKNTSLLTAFGGRRDEERTRTCLDRLDGRVPEPRKPGRDAPQPAQLLRAERHPPRGIIAAA